MKNHLRKWQAQDLDIDVLRVYSGADASFQLYLDAGDGYGYEKGQYQVVDLKWNEKKRQLAIFFDKMPQENKKYMVELVSKDKGI